MPLAYLVLLYGPDIPAIGHAVSRILVDGTTLIVGVFDMVAPEALDVCATAHSDCLACGDGGEERLLMFGV